MTVSVKRPWNPLAIAWLGLLFTPAWTGIMTAINTGRLKSDQPLWRPLAIGIGSTVLDILLSCAGFHYILLDILFMTVPLIAIWNTDLAQQEEAYSEESPKSQDHWILPVLAGSPITLLLIVGWWFALFAPLEPSEVVKQFVDAGKTEERQKYVTLNLSPLLKDINKLNLISPDESKYWIYKSNQFEILNEYYVEEGDNNQQYVEYRAFIAPETGGVEVPIPIEGYYHLRRIENQWKIDDLIIRKINSEELEQPIWLSQVIQLAIEEERKQANNQSNKVVTKPLIDSSKPSLLKQTTEGFVRYPGGFIMLIKGLFVGGGLKKIGSGILLVIAAGAAALRSGFLGGGGGETK